MNEIYQYTIYYEINNTFHSLTIIITLLRAHYLYIKFIVFIHMAVRQLFVAKSVVFLDIWDS